MCQIAIIRPSGANVESLRRLVESHGDEAVEIDLEHWAEHRGELEAADRVMLDEVGVTPPTDTMMDCEEWCHDSRMIKEVVYLVPDGMSLIDANSRALVHHFSEKLNL